MISKKQAEHNRNYRRKVKANYGGYKCFGAGTNSKRKHEFGVLAFTPSRGRMNGRLFF